MKQKGNFSKAIVLLVICSNVIFTSMVLYIFLRTSSEPSSLVMSWFGFTTAELWSLASIKKTKENNKNGGDVND